MKKARQHLLTGLLVADMATMVNRKVADMDTFYSSRIDLTTRATILTRGSCTAIA